MDSGINFCDHLSIIVDGKIDVVSAKSCSVNTDNKPAGKKHFCICWDKADISGYYDYSYKTLRHINIDNFHNCHLSVTRIDNLGIQMVDCLEESA